MSDPPSAWEAADKAYQAHHFSCQQCIAAGVTRSQERCRKHPLPSPALERGFSFLGLQ